MAECERCNAYFDRDWSRERTQVICSNCASRLERVVERFDAMARRIPVPGVPQSFWTWEAYDDRLKHTMKAAERIETFIEKKRGEG